MFTQRIRFMKALLAAMMFMFAASAFGQAYPNRAIKIIVPYGVGGATDTTTRMIATRLAEKLKQPVVVENRPGAGSMTGMNALKNAAPDGYTIGLIVSASAAQPWLTKQMPFDVRKDFMPMTMGYLGPLVLTVSESFPAKTLQEFIAYTKANPAKNFTGSVGLGTTANLAAELLKQVAGINLTNVTFKGAPEVHTAVLGGEIQSGFDSYSGPKALVEAGRLRVLAVTGKQRLAVLPNVPTVHEFYPGFDISSWIGFAAPLGTPRPIVDLLTSELRTALQDPEVRKYVADVVGGEAGGGTPAELQQRIVDDYDRFGKVIQAAGIKLE